MTAIQKFTEKYGISPLKLVEDTHLKYLGFIKSNGLIRALENFVEDEKLNIEIDSEFEKNLVEAFAEAGERFPENGKISELEGNVLLSIPSVNAGVPKSKGTLENFKEIVGRDELRPAMSGVFVSEDGANLVGTDAHKLVVQKSSEYSEYAGKIIDLKVYLQTKGKKLSFIDGKYPNYKAILPQDSPNEVKNFDTYALYNFAKSTIAVHKLVNQTMFNINLKLPSNGSEGSINASFNPVLAVDLLVFALANGWSKFTLEYSEISRAFILNFGDGNTGLLMPILNREGGEFVLRGSEVMTPEEIMEKYKLSKGAKISKPTAKKTVTPSAPVSSEPFKKFEGNLSDTTYIHRSQIESITLKSGEVLGKNDVIDGFYRVNKKMAHGGSMYADGGNLGKTDIKTYKLRAEGLNDFLAFLQNDMYFKMKSFTIEPTGFPDVVVTFDTSSSLSEIKQKLREVPDSHVMLQTVKPINEYTGEREVGGKYAHGGSMYAGGGYIRPSYDTKVSGKYDFKTNTGVGYEIAVVGFERKNDDSDSLYFDDSESTAKKELGSIIIKNNSWKNLSKGKTIIATSGTGINGKLTRIGNLYGNGGSMSSSHEVGDTVTFNSVMGGTKTGTIVSKMGEEGFRVQVGNGFATIKKSAIV